MDIAYGQCMCGCGQRTNILEYNDGRGGLQGQPRKYIKGHAGRNSPVEYIVSENGCWEWQRALRPQGYGMKLVNGKYKYAHRIYYERYKAEIPDGMLVCHKCDNRKCVNPDHLFLGTNSDNILDAKMKGRLKRKLTWSNVEKIRGLYKPRIYSLNRLAKEFGVSKRCILYIIQGKQWIDHAKIKGV